MIAKSATVEHVCIPLTARSNDGFYMDRGIAFDLLWHHSMLTVPSQVGLFVPGGDFGLATQRHVRRALEANVFSPQRGLKILIEVYLR